MKTKRGLMGKIIVIVVIILIIVGVGFMVYNSISEEEGKEIGQKQEGGEGESSPNIINFEQEEGVDSPPIPSFID